MKILHIVLNDFVNDNRVIRSASTGREMGGDIQVFALHRDDLLQEEQVNGFDVQRFRLLTRPWPKNKIIQLFKYAEVIFRMLWAGRRYRPNLVHAHDLNALPIGYGIALLTRAKLIYDSHELWSDPMHRRQFPHWMFRIGLSIERFFARRASAVVTVSDGIAREMEGNMGIVPPLVIRNLPFLQEGASSDSIETAVRLRKGLNVPPNAPIILYQGGVANGRGVGVLLQAMEYLCHPTAILVYLGDGAQIEELRQQASSKGLEGRVLFHPAVPPLSLPEYTREADIGVHPLEATCLSHRLALPNKLFEYLQAGLPVVVSDLPEMRAVVDRYGIGAVFPAGNARELAARLDELLKDENRLANCKRGARRAAKELNWSHEKVKLQALYLRLLPRDEAFASRKLPNI